MNKIPNLRCIANDISSEAISLAHDNATRNHLTEKLTLIQSSLFEALSSKESKLDFIVSNPPYIDPNMRNELEPELHMEPEIALYCSDSGRAIPKLIIQQAKAFLKPNSPLYLEIASYNAKSLCDFALDYFTTVEIIEDQNSLSRWLIAR